MRLHDLNPGLSVDDPERVLAGAHAAGHVVICGGGGGAPVVPDDAGGLRGVEAVIDKDLTAAIGTLTDAADVLDGKAGTTITAHSQIDGG